MRPGEQMHGDDMKQNLCIIAGGRFFSHWLAFHIRYVHHADNF